MRHTPLRASLNAYLARHAGADRPPFYDVATHFPHLLELDHNFPVIRDELDNALRVRRRLPRYEEVDPRQTLSAGEEGHQWKVFPFYLMGFKPEANRALCPRTSALIDRVPDLFQAMFSILEPRKSVPPHHGPYLGYLRYHLGLKIPAHNPPRIRVKDVDYTWQEGKGVVLDDSWEHEVFNESDEIRVVLIVDFLRPLPRVPATVNRVVCRRVIPRIYARNVARNLAAFQ